MAVSRWIGQLADYGIANGLLEPVDRTYVINRILEALALDFYEEQEAEGALASLEEILKQLLDDAGERGLLEPDSITARDLLDTKLMGCLVPRPSQMIRRFWVLYEQSPQRATDFYYDLSKAADYIRTYRIARDIKWQVQTGDGVLDITINRAKPEKDPKAIAAAGRMRANGYPKCLLCRENEGYSGRLDHPARQNLRLIPIRLCGERWYMQYSPYVYYNEHCIVLNESHVPMKINRSAFEKLLEFVTLFPHYFIGSNADLPIVGGSILSHEHFQGGCYEFAMARAPIEKAISFKGYEDVEAGIVRWPLSVIRLKSEEKKRLAALADRILCCWRGYTDAQAHIFAQTDGEAHNTITPIARRCGKLFELDLVLRNNRTTKEHPYGLFHPHEEYHHIKKENIGLIEVMGLAVLPARLEREMALLRDALLCGRDVAADPNICSHARWAGELKEKYPHMDAQNIDGILRQEIGYVFAAVLEQCGVFKRSPEGRDAFDRFIREVL